MTDDDFAALIERGHELRGIEFKPPGLRGDKDIMAWVTRAALGMANRRDGGYVIVGVVESGGKPEPRGLTESELASWTYDDVADILASCSDPAITVELETRHYLNRPFVLLRVREFAELPILASKDVVGSRKQVIRRGACYVRSHGKPETSEVPSQEEMRELLGLAIENGVRRFLATAMRVGLNVGEPSRDSPSGSEEFRKQLGDLQ